MLIDINFKSKSIVQSGKSINPIMSASKCGSSIIATIIMLFVIGQLQAQQFNNWYFGNRAGINFTGAPLAVTNGQLVTMEGCATMSDNNGDLLFYTDGVTVWNRNHVAMPNGAGLTGHSSATQSAIIVPRPGSSTLFYVFTVDADNGANGIRYSVVDMNLSAGLGNVTAEKNILLQTPSCEKLQAVRHCNGVDIWVISHDWNSNAFRTWLVSSSGLNTTPVISNAGVVVTGVVQSSYGQLKSNHLGNKLIGAYYGLGATGANRYEMYDFNNSTGVVSNAVLLSLETGAYGCEFSPDGRLAYGATNQGRLYQFNLCAGSTAAIQASKTLIVNTGPLMGALQLAPDGRIYISRNAAFLSVIQNPNTLGLGCNYVNASFSLLGRTSGMGLPTFPWIYARPPIPDFTFSSTCLNANFTAPTTSTGICSVVNPIIGYNWNFGDPTTGANNVSTLANPAHTFSATGTYSVRLILNLGCYSDTIIRSVTISGFNLTTSSTNATCSASNGSVSVSVATPGTYTYLWTPGNYTTATVNNLAAGTYQVQVTGAGGCVSTASATVANSGGMSVSIPAASILCNGQNATITANITGGTAPYQYAWSNAATTQSIQAGAGTHTVTVTDANGCSQTSSTTLTQPTVLQTTVAQMAATCNNSNGTATASPTGGTGPYTYSWNTVPVQTNATATGLLPGTYQVLVSDANGCQITRNVTVTSQGSAAIMLMISNMISCHGANDGMLSASILNGTSPFTFVWSTGATGIDLNNVGPGTYSVTVTDANGCVATESATLTSPSQITASVTALPASCFGANGSATVSVTGGGSPPYSYLWNTGATTSSINNVAAGNYTCSVTDANGCVINLPVNIVQPASSLGLTITPTHGSCLSPLGSAIANATGGTAPYTYMWSNGASTSSALALNPGNYSVEVTDANGCTLSESVQIMGSTTIQVSLNAQDVNCFGASTGQITSTISGGTAPYTALWNDGITTQNRTGLNSGNYSISVTDANGCVATASTVINQPGAILLSTTATQEICGNQNGTATVNASGGIAPYTYSWNTLPIQTTQTANGLSAGSYQVIVTDGNGCSANATATVTNSGGLTAQIQVNSHVSCFSGNDGSLGVIANGGLSPYSYTWSNGPTTAMNTNLIAGNYSVQITDGNGCTLIVSETITEPLELSGVISSNNVTCHNLSNGQASILVSGGMAPYTYQWSNGSQNNTAISLAAGNYTVIVRDQMNCEFTESVVINAPLALQINVNRTDVSCSGAMDGSIQLIVQGGSQPYTASWSNGMNGLQHTGLNGGTYSYVLTDNNGCQQNGNVILIEPVLLQVSETITHPSCAGGDNGQIQLSVSGGSLPYTFAWADGNSQEDRIGLTAGGYTLTLSDQNGCAQTESFTLVDPIQIQVSYTATPSECNGSNGSATINANGGQAPYLFSMDGSANQSGNFFGSLTTGMHTLQVSDQDGCIVTEQVFVPSPASLEIQLSNIQGTLCSTTNQGSATVSVINGSAPFQFLWSSNETDSIASALAAGEAWVRVTDAAGCMVMESFTILSPEPLSFTTDIEAVDCYGNSTGSILVIPAGGTAPYQANWQSGQVGLFIEQLPFGTYNLSLSDANNCLVLAELDVEQPGQPIQALSTVIPGSCGNAGGSITMSAFGGTAPYTYQWGNNVAGNVPVASNLGQGTYSLTITDARQCEATFTAELLDNEPIQVTASNIVGLSCHGAEDGTVELNVTGGAMPYQYNWGEGNESAAPAGLGGGSYTLVVTDASGCTGSVNFTIPQPALLGAIVTPQHTNCFGGDDGRALLNVTGGTQPYTYAWSNGAVTMNADNLTAGTISCEITDANGCSINISTTINQPAEFQVNLSITQPGCSGNDNGSITPQVTGGTLPYSFQWSNGSQSSELDALAAGAYTVNIIDGNGCLQQYSVELQSAEVFEVYIEGSTHICEGEQAVVVAQGSVPHMNYLYTWNHGIIGESFSANPNQTTTYTVVVRDTAGCVVVDTFTVIVNPKPSIAIVAADTAGCAPFCAKLEAVSNTANFFNWTLGDGTSRTGQFVDYCYELPGVYPITVSIKDENNCSNFLNWSERIVVHPSPVAAFQPYPPTTTIDEPMIQFVDQSDGASQYLYHFGDPNQSSVMLANSSFAYQDTGTFEVSLQVSNDFGCVDAAVRTVHIGGFTAFYIPTAFTPNRDGLNDVFIPKSTGLAPDGFEMRIFDRWGNLISISDSWDKGWDGTVNGKQVPMDQYICKVRYYEKSGKGKDHVSSVIVTE